MQVSKKSKFYLLKKIVVLFNLILIIFASSINLNYSSLFNLNREEISKLRENDMNNGINLKSSSSDVLIEGTETALNITDFGNLYNVNQEISLNNEAEKNTSFFIDKDNDWNATKVEIDIFDLQDTRNWINNSGFQNFSIFRKYDTYESSHYGYEDGRDRLDPDNTITESGAYYIRAHFINISFHSSDHIYLYNSSVYEYYEATGERLDFYSPWISGDTIYVCYQSNYVTNNYYGYIIDHYEFINASSEFYLNNNSWSFNWEKNGVYGANTYGFGEMGGAIGLFVGYHGDYDDTESFTYWEDTYSELYQENINVPRGNIVDASISFDYYIEFGMATNDIVLFFEINDKKVYSKGMIDLIEQGKHQWHSTGQIPMYLWNNLTNIFESGDIEDQELNVSIGLKWVGDIGVTYTGFEDVFGNILWFDNISLSLTAIANTTSDYVNLTINQEIIDKGLEWGKSNHNPQPIFKDNEIILTFNTTSPDLTFALNTTIYGYHEAKSYVNQIYDEGVNYRIMDNGTIFWEFLHEFYKPSYYSDFTMNISKIESWECVGVYDKYSNLISFEGGNPGDSYINITEDNTINTGWWTIICKSPNYINITNTKNYKNGEWGNFTFRTGQFTKIQTQINYSNDIPPNLAEHDVNLTIYHPNGTIYYEENITPTPLNDGYINSSFFSFGPTNTTGGEYTYTILWSNGTALGGVKSSFILNHNSTVSLLKPHDAISDLTTDCYLGDIIPLKVELYDFENSQPILGAVISYNISSGNEYFENASLGIYEATIDTSDDIGSNGQFEIFINASKKGFENYNLTLLVNINNATSLHRVSFENQIELHDNTTIKFLYEDANGVGIKYAETDLNISENNYSIYNHLDGHYSIEINSSSISNLGSNQIEFTFSAPYYETQIDIFEFEIIEQSVNLSVYVKNTKIEENSLEEISFKESLNLSVRAMGEVDKVYLSGGNLTINSDNYYENITLYPDNWFNISIIISSNNFSSGLNDIYLNFGQNKYRTERFRFQLLVGEQVVNLSVYLDSKKISVNSLYQVMYKQEINISAQVYAKGEKIYLNDGLLTFNAQNYNVSLPSELNDWFTISVKISSLNFTTGINNVYVQFQLSNYSITTFSFQLFVSEQSVDLFAYINSNPIQEDILIEVSYEETLSLALRSYAYIDEAYLSGASVKFVSQQYEMVMAETSDTWYTGTLKITRSHFSQGANNAILQFEMMNYTTSTFSFQILVREQELNISVLVNSQEISENSLLEVNFNDEINISARIFALTESKYLSEGNLTFRLEQYSKNFTEISESWYNLTIKCSNSEFSLGLNYIYLNFEKDNYQTTQFAFQIKVNQIEFNPETVNFTDSLDIFLGENAIITINLTEMGRSELISGAQVTYSWEFGLGTLNETDEGIYSFKLNTNQLTKGSYSVTLTISKEGNLFKTKQISFVVVISERETPFQLFWVILAGLLVVVGVLGALSYRSYILLPKKRKKESELLAKTQRFRDLENIQAIVVIHKLSGIPIYLKSYSILESQKKELFAGFIQAITSISQEFKKETKHIKDVKDVDETLIMEKIIELDFKYFYCLIADKESVRIVFILKERASNRLKEQAGYLLTAMMLKLGDMLNDWDGNIDQFDEPVPEVINEYFELYYKETFTLNSADYIAMNKKEAELTSMETQVLNVVYAIAKGKKPFDFSDVFNVIYGENRNVIIEAIENLITRKIVIPYVPKPV